MSYAKSSSRNPAGKPQEIGREGLSNVGSLRDGSWNKCATDNDIVALNEIPVARHSNIRSAQVDNDYAHTW